MVVWLVSVGALLFDAVDADPLVLGWTFAVVTPTVYSARKIRRRQWFYFCRKLVVPPPPGKHHERTRDEWRISRCPRGADQGHCLANGLDLVTIYRDEGVSAGVPLAERPKGQEMLAVLSRGEAAHVVAAKLDRLFRNVLDCLVNVGKWDKAGVSLHLLDLNLNTATAFGQAFLAITAAFAALERNLIKERIVAALAHKKANRLVYTHTPFGFGREGDRLVTNEVEQAVVRRIKELDAASVPMLRIAERLNKEGVPTKRKARWYASTVRAILTNGLSR